MCYYAQYIFLFCGHIALSDDPVPHAPPCSGETEGPFGVPILASSINLGGSPDDRDSSTHAGPQLRGPSDQSRSQSMECKEQWTHPLHTYRVGKLCPECSLVCEQRLARLEVTAIKDSVDRSMSKLKQRERVEVHGLKPRPLKLVQQENRDPNQNNKDEELQLQSPLQQSPAQMVGQYLMGGVRGMMRWQQPYTGDTERGQRRRSYPEAAESPTKVGRRDFQSLSFAGNGPAKNFAGNV